MRKDSRGCTWRSRERWVDEEGEEGEGIWVRDFLENDKQGNNQEDALKWETKPGNHRPMAHLCHVLLLLWWGPSNVATRKKLIQQLEEASVRGVLPNGTLIFKKEPPTLLYPRGAPVSVPLLRSNP